jgi:CRP-like cAMP-binding protein
MSKQITLTQAILAEESTSLQGLLSTVELSDKQVLFQPGDPGDAFYIIDSGKIRIFTHDEEGKELTLNTLDAGEAFGELALLDDQPRTAGAAAAGAATLRCMRREDFLAQVHTSPTLTDIVIRLLVERTRHMTDYIEWLGHWARLVAQGKYNQAMKNIQDQEDGADRALAAVAEAVKSMVEAVQKREEQLKKEVKKLQIQIDETKRQQQVDEITETDYFQKLTSQARDLRKRSKE